MSLPAAFVAAFFAAMGVVTLVRPALAWAPFGVAPNTPASRNEIRGVYGGFGVAIATMIFLSRDAATPYQDGVLTVVAVACLGMAGGRLAGLIVEPRGIRGFPGLFLVVELGLATLAWAATPGS